MQWNSIVVFYDVFRQRCNENHTNDASAKYSLRTWHVHISNDDMMPNDQQLFGAAMVSHSVPSWKLWTLREFENLLLYLSSMVSGCLISEPKPWELKHHLIIVPLHIVLYCEKYVVLSITSWLMITFQSSWLHIYCKWYLNWSISVLSHKILS